MNKYEIVGVVGEGNTSYCYFQCKVLYTKFVVCILRDICSETIKMVY